MRMIEDYARFLGELKERIRTAQVKAALAASSELIALYWDIGRSIVGKQKQRGWGAAVVDQLARDLKAEFPDSKSFSRYNLWEMRRFFLAYSKLQQPVGVLTKPRSRGNSQMSHLRIELPPPVVLKLPWGHNIELLHKVDESALRLWYAQQAIKDPYTFDFLTVAAAAKERALENGLLDHLQKLLLELGAGFAFVGRQVPLEVEGEDYRLDLLFYHLRLRCFVVIELKSGPFKPEHAGKMGFYLAAVDAQWRHPEDRPSIGLILCQSKKRLIVEYALRDSNRPIGVSSFRATRTLPKELAEQLPKVDELESHLGGA